MVFGGDGLSAWAGVGPALYFNSSWGGSEDVFYTQNAKGDGIGQVHNSTLKWKNQGESGLKEGFTSYHVEFYIDTGQQIENGNGVYQVYMAPYAGGRLFEKTLITTGTAPGTNLQGWHGFRTSFAEITKIGVWTNYGTVIQVDNFRAKYLEGDLATVTVEYILDDEPVDMKFYRWRVSDTFKYNAPKTLKYNDTLYYLVSGEDELSALVSGYTQLTVRYQSQNPNEGGRVFYASFDGEEEGVELFGNTGLQLGQKGNSLHLDGTNSYAKLAGGLMSNLEDFTITGFFKADSFSSWARIFDFGNNQTVNMFLTPKSADGFVVFAMTTGGSSAEQRITTYYPFLEGQWYHFAITLEKNVATLYIDGKETGSNRVFSLKPKDLGNTTNNFIGKSQYPDPYFNGNIDEFEIFPYAMSADEVNLHMEKTAARVEKVKEIHMLKENYYKPQTADVIFENGLVGKARIYEWMVSSAVERGTFNMEIGYVRVFNKRYQINVYIHMKNISLIDDLKIAHIMDDETGGATVKYAIIGNCGGELLFAIAEYDGGKLVKVKTKTVALEGEENVVSLTLPGADINKTRAFVWNKKLEPVAITVDRMLK